MTESVILLTAKLLNARKSMKSLFRENYAEKTKFYREILLAVSKSRSIEILQSALWICENSDAIKNNDMAIILTLSSSLDLIEERDGK